MGHQAPSFEARRKPPPLPTSSLTQPPLTPLKHAVGVGGFFRNILNDIPVLDDLAVLELENIDDRAATASLLAHAMDVQDHIIAIGKYAFDLAVGVGKFFTQEIPECLKTLGPIRRRGIMLNIARPDKFRGGVEVFPVKPHLVKFKHSLLVGLLHRLVRGGRRRCYEGQHTDKAGDNDSHEVPLCHRGWTGSYPRCRQIGNPRRRASYFTLPVANSAARTCTAGSASQSS